MTQTYARPETRLKPVPTEQTEAFWTGGKDGQLLISYCNGCGHYFHQPAPVCWRCRSIDVEPKPVSGRARVATFTVNRQPWVPGFPPPYVIAMVELEDEPDVRLQTNIVGIAPEEVDFGMDVEVFFEQWDDVWIPLFRPVGGAA